MNNGSNGIERYFQSTRAAFDSLRTVYKHEGPWAKRHDVISRIVREHLRRLRQSFECWDRRRLDARAFKIDTAESGLPIFHHALELQEDFSQASARLREIPAPDQIRDDMIEYIFDHKRLPEDLQSLMARRLYFESLRQRPVFTTVTPPETVRFSINPRTKRPFYVVHWASYDGSANLPLIYMAVIEDSSGGDIVPPNPGRHLNNTARPKFRPLEGLPNRTLTEPFAAFAANHSSYSLSLTSIATALDKDFANLHPKQLKRFVLGPFYVGDITRHNERVQSVLDEVDDPSHNWLLTWAVQELHSKEEKPAKHGLWGGSPAEEIFYINTDDLECARQGVSAYERHALVPHAAYQALHAQGRADETFDGYQCHIVSGENILEHV